MEATGSAARLIYKRSSRQQSHRLGRRCHENRCSAVTSRATSSLTTRRSLLLHLLRVVFKFTPPYRRRTPPANWALHILQELSYGNDPPNATVSKAHAMALQSMNVQGQEIERREWRQASWPQPVAKDCEIARGKVQGQKLSCCARRMDMSSTPTNKCHRVHCRRV